MVCGSVSPLTAEQKGIVSDLQTMVEEFEIDV